MWWKKNKWKVILPVLVIAALAAAFWFGGGSPADRGWSAGSKSSPAPAATAAPEPAATPEPVPTAEVSAAPTATPVPEPTPEPAETPTGSYVTMSISCAAILDHMDWLDPDKVELIPEDGWILKPVTVPLEEGESVFDLLRRVTRDNKIHMEYSQAPMYGSAYIEGIYNLYELDCGEGSGWMYSVNGWYPNYGCSGYALEPGDVVEWRYTCETGEDIGGGYVPEEGN